MCQTGVKDVVKEVLIRKWSDPINWANGILP